MPIFRRGLAVAAILATCTDLAAQRSFFTAEVVSVTPLSHDVKRLRVRLPKQYRFEPGQFALIRLPHSFVESWNAEYKTSHGEVTRPYSFALSPARLPLAEFIVQWAAPPPNQHVPPGIASTFIHDQLKPGDELEVSEPMGSLDRAGHGDTGRPLVLVAGGTGVAPFVGLLDHWFKTKQHEQCKIYLFFGARQRRDLILDGQFRRWAARHPHFTYVPALSDPVPGDRWTGATGLIAAVLDSYFNRALDADVLVAGSPRMMQETVTVARAKGVAPARIRHDPIQVAP